MEYERDEDSKNVNARTVINDVLQVTIATLWRKEEVGEEGRTKAKDRKRGMKKVGGESNTGVKKKRGTKHKIKEQNQGQPHP